MITKNKPMKRLFTIAILLVCWNMAHSQFVITMEVDEPINGVCDNDKIYAIFPMIEGQQEAICPVSKDAILKRLNNDVEFLKDKPKYKDKGMIGLIINCKGELVKCEMDNKTQSTELDKQIEDVFKSLGEWKAGKLNGNDVDSSKLYSFKIKKGKFTFD